MLILNRPSEKSLKYVPSGRLYKDLSMGCPFCAGVSANKEAIPACETQDKRQSRPGDTSLCWATSINQCQHRARGASLRNFTNTSSNRVDKRIGKNKV
ncbi:hypothetical protein PoB_007486700 [Plakobranchus ocellatus]|uniref:Uncharacterized protein n=1 Tax=Plakobranchus ocellatus TaxID=259542 RepID=A0AAV4DVP2_9GAST|nr:hypothetical protein PoB_007486700 [Plakobranchus ocellatus]